MFLSDIRRELKLLREEIAKLTAVPQILRGIRKNTYKRRKTVRVRQIRPKA
jgi:hypothetical protein